LICLVGSQGRTGTSQLGIYLAYSLELGASSSQKKVRTGGVPLRWRERLLPQRFLSPPMPFFFFSGAGQASPAARSGAGTSATEIRRGRAPVERRRTERAASSGAVGRPQDHHRAPAPAASSAPARGPPAPSGLRLWPPGSLSRLLLSSAVCAQRSSWWAAARANGRRPAAVAQASRGSPPATPARGSPTALDTVIFFFGN
jgi:hypothetical protein